VKNLFKNEKGSFDIGGIMMLSIAMVFLSIGFIFLPISTSAVDSLRNWTYATTNATMTSPSIFTGYTSVVGITPLLILVGFLAASVVTGMMGIKIMKGGESTKADPGSLMMVGLSIVFISIGLIIEPVVLDGVASVIHNGGAGISSTYTGYASVIKIAPMLVHIAFLTAAVLSGFFGIKKLTAGASS
jgi:hypothetical protein